MPDGYLDPFENNSVSDIRRIDDPIKDLNEAPLNQLVREFEQLAEGPPPRSKSLPRVQFVLSAQAGYGKSFLLGLLFKKLCGRATLVYLRPFEDPATCWKSILDQTIQELDCPEKVEPGFSPNNEPTQLQIFAHGILTRLSVLFLEKEKKDNHQKDQIIEYLQQATL
ncbi:MAG: hypothetical protein HQK55_08215, partial [Deltaproteobacteria bacterium]|nr:hypothetical protein [Deltaproteobacteria bacterium]